MTPIEKVRARAEALNTLGVSRSATEAEIHAAWRRQVFRLHPDQNPGKEAEFGRIRWAYDLLCEGAGSARAPAPPAGQPRPRRPDLCERVMELPERTIAECRAALDSRPSRRKVTDHLPGSVRRRGREMTFLVRTPLVEGPNRIALPADNEAHPRPVPPRVVRFNSPRSGVGIINVPAALLPQMFPGARRVSIEFTGA